MGGCCECNDPMTKKQLDAHLLQHSYGSRCDLLHRTTLKWLKHYYDGHLHREYNTKYIEDEKVKNKWKDDLDFIDESVDLSIVSESFGPDNIRNREPDVLSVVVDENESDVDTSFVPGMFNEYVSESINHKNEDVNESDVDTSIGIENVTTTINEDNLSLKDNVSVLSSESSICSKKRNSCEVEQFSSPNKFRKKKNGASNCIFWGKRNVSHPQHSCAVESVHVCNGSDSVTFRSDMFANNMIQSFKSKQNSSKRTVSAKNAFRDGYSKCDKSLNLFLSDEDNKCDDIQIALRTLKKMKKLESLPNIQVSKEHLIETEYLKQNYVVFEDPKNGQRILEVHDSTNGGIHYLDKDSGSFSCILLPRESSLRASGRKQFNLCKVLDTLHSMKGAQIRRKIDQGNKSPYSVYGPKVLRGSVGLSKQTFPKGKETEKPKETETKETEKKDTEKPKEEEKEPLSADDEKTPLGKLVKELKSIQHMSDTDIVSVMFG